MQKPDLWLRLAGSPELRPTTPSVTSSLHLERPDDVFDMDTDATPAGGPPLLDSVIHTHELPAEFAYAYFERDVGVADVQTPSGNVVANEHPVTPRVVRADRVVWRPVLSNDGLCGHRFDLMLGDALQAHVEAFVDAHSVRRVAFVHRNYSQTARAAGLVDRNSLVEFNSPESHAAKLREMLASLPCDQYYLPVAEVAVGQALCPRFGAPLSLHPRHAKNPAASVAGAVWSRVKLEIAVIWEMARAASNAHNLSEFRRTGLS